MSGRGRRTPKSLANGLKMAERQELVLRRTAEGVMPPDIAKEAGCSLSTVRNDILGYIGLAREQGGAHADKIRDRLLDDLAIDFELMRRALYRAYQLFLRKEPTVDEDGKISVPDVPRQVSENYFKALEKFGDFTGLTPAAEEAAASRSIREGTGIRSVPQFIERMEQSPALRRALIKGGLLDYLQKSVATEAEAHGETVEAEA